jgi:hypothetical protein
MVEDRPADGWYCLSPGLATDRFRPVDCLAVGTIQCRAFRPRVEIQSAISGRSSLHTLLLSSRIGKWKRKALL